MQAAHGSDLYSSLLLDRLMAGLNVSRTILWLTAGLLALVILGFLTERRLRFNPDLLSVLDPSVPEVRAHILHRDEFLCDHDFIIGIDTASAAATDDALASLARHLKEAVPALRNQLQLRYPWETDLASAGELVAYVWANSSTRDLRRLWLRLSPANVDAALANAEETASAPALPDLRRRWQEIDPLELALVPGLEAPPATPTDPLPLRSPSGRLRLILVTLPGSSQEISTLRDWNRQLRQAATEWKHGFEGAASVQLTFTGQAVHLVETRSQIGREFLLSILTTVTGIITLIYFAYRLLAPLLFLLLTLTMALLLTVHLALLVFGSLNPMSVGFAPILIALVVDYTILIVQERSQSVSHGTGFSLILPISWAAFTTAFVFAGLNLSSVPGLAEFGTLVASGIFLGATLSLTYFARSIRTLRFEPPPPLTSRLALSPDFHAAATIAAGFGAAGVLLGGGIPEFDLDPDNLQSRPTDARRNLELLQEKLRPDHPPSEGVLVLSQEPRDVRAALGAWERIMADRFPSAEFLSPAPLWPRHELRDEHRAVLRRILDRREQILDRFTGSSREAARRFLEEAFGYWGRYVEGEGARIPLPEGRVGAWAFDQTIRERIGEWSAAKGFIQWLEQPDLKRIETMRTAARATDGVILLDWSHLQPVFDDILEHDIRYVLFPLVGLLILLLLVAFRSWADTALAVLAVLTSALLMLAGMKIAGIEWNQLNFIAIPLIVGVGLDYSIHMIFALRRSGGDLVAVRTTLGRALFVCGGSSMIGFASLNWSANPGLSSLGQICALGVASAFFTAVVLLPGWWLHCYGPGKVASTPPRGRS